ncbi:MAG: hypothetical protein HYR67_20345, partial [Bacteroidetes bacterium]|nr:hypothetical protein [Bacteroidota bacterium]
MHHAYDPMYKMLIFGDGSRRSAPPTYNVINTIAGTGFRSNSGDGGPAALASIAGPRGIATGPDGSVYFSSDNIQFRRIGPDGIITTVAGNGTYGSGGDGGPATLAQFNYSSDGLAVGADGSLYISDTMNYRVRKVDAKSGFVTTVAGNGTSAYSGDGGPAAFASLSWPTGIAIGPDGSLYISDGNCRIRRVGPDGIISTVVGNGTCGFSGDGGSATLAQIYGHDVVVGTDGTLYVSDIYRIRRVGTDGIITTIAGNGPYQYPWEGGPATAAPIDIDFFTIGPDGSLYFSDYSDYYVWKIDTKGIITGVAGNVRPTRGYAGDGGPATLAQFNHLEHIAVGRDGSLYLADRRNNRVRKVSSPLPGFTNQQIVLPSEDGVDLYVF